MSEAAIPAASQSWSAARIRLCFYAFVALYYALQIIVRTLVSNSLELDEAEQVFLSQWLLLGYGPEPPLYTWLQIGLNNILGAGVFSLSLLKNLLLFLTLAFVFESGRILLKNSLTAALAAASLLFLPQIVWESQRDLTHSVLVTTMAAAAVLVSIQLARRPSLLRFMAVGLVFGLGLIAKYNFAILAVILLLLLACRKDTRQVFRDRRLLLVPVLILLVAGPHYIWYLLHLDVSTGSVHKFGLGQSGWPWEGLISLAEAAISFLTPLWVIFLAVFWPGRQINPPWQAAREHTAPRILQSYFLLLAIVFVLGVLFFQLTEFKSRWMQPLLFIFPVYLFSLLDLKRLGQRSIRIWLGAVLAVAGLVLILIPGRVVLGPSLDYITHFNMPYNGLAAHLQERNLDSGLILTRGSRLAGNLGLHLSRARILDPVLGRQLIPKSGAERKAVLVWDVERTGEDPPQKVMDFARDKLQMQPLSAKTSKVELPYKYSRDNAQTHTFKYLLLGKAQEKKQD
ncbi:MAG: glycosyltransferase family 39 protein [Thermodesulfobacteriota bacterium]